MYFVSSQWTKTGLNFNTKLNLNQNFNDKLDCLGNLWYTWACTDCSENVKFENWNVKGLKQLLAVRTQWWDSSLQKCTRPHRRSVPRSQSERHSWSESLSLLSREWKRLHLTSIRFGVNLAYCKEEGQPNPEWKQVLECWTLNYTSKTIQTIFTENNRRCFLMR